MDLMGITCSMSLSDFCSSGKGRRETPALLMVLISLPQLKPPFYISYYYWTNLLHPALHHQVLSEPSYMLLLTAVLTVSIAPLNCLSNLIGSTFSVVFTARGNHMQWFSQHGNVSLKEMMISKANFLTEKLK